MLEEHVFLNENNVVVSNVRFTLNDEETYAIAGVVYIRMAKAKKQVRFIRLLIGFLLAIAGLIMSMENPLGSVGLVVGLILMAIAVKKNPQGIEIKTAAGESLFYSDRDRQFVEKVFSAINDAMIFRG